MRKIDKWFWNQQGEPEELPKMCGHNQCQKNDRNTLQKNFERERKIGI